jgi:hypothetical protein
MYKIYIYSIFASFLFVRPMRLLGYGEWLLIAPIILSLPILLKQITVRLFFIKDATLNKIDLYVFTLISLFLLAIFNSLLYNPISYNYHILFYFISGIYVYLLVRLLSWSFDHIYTLTLLWLFLASMYSITEFYLYYTYPDLVKYVGYYKTELQGVNVFNIPEHVYIFGNSIKPYGVLMEASSSGVFSALMFVFLLIFHPSTPTNNIYFYLVMLLGLFSIYLSGSKTAYLFLVISLFLFSVFSSKINLKNRLYFLAVSMAFLAFLFGFFLIDGRLDKYYNSMILFPIASIFDMIGNNFINIIFGSGEVGLGSEGVYLTEVDFINSIVRYGFLFLATFLLIIFKSLKNKKNHTIFFIAILLSMMHYSVIFKFPVFSYLMLIVASQVNMNKTPNKLIN